MSKRIKVFFQVDREGESVPAMVHKSGEFLTITQSQYVHLSRKLKRVTGQEMIQTRSPGQELPPRPIFVLDAGGALRQAIH